MKIILKKAISIKPAVIEIDEDGFVARLDRPFQVGGGQMAYFPETLGVPYLPEHCGGLPVKKFAQLYELWQDLDKRAKTTTRRISETPVSFRVHPYPVRSEHGRPQNPAAVGFDIDGGLIYAGVAYPIEAVETLQVLNFNTCEVETVTRKKPDPWGMYTVEYENAALSANFVIKNRYTEKVVVAIKSISPKREMDYYDDNEDLNAATSRHIVKHGVSRADILATKLVDVYGIEEVAEVSFTVFGKTFDATVRALREYEDAEKIDVNFYIAGNAEFIF